MGLHSGAFGYHEVPAVEVRRQAIDADSISRTRTMNEVTVARIYAAMVDIRVLALKVEPVPGLELIDRHRGPDLRLLTCCSRQGDAELPEYHPDKRRAIHPLAGLGSAVNIPNAGIVHRGAYQLVGPGSGLGRLIAARPVGQAIDIALARDKLVAGQSFTFLEGIQPTAPLAISTPYQPSSSLTITSGVSTPTVLYLAALGRLGPINSRRGDT